MQSNYYFTFKWKYKLFSSLYFILFTRSKNLCTYIFWISRSADGEIFSSTCLVKKRFWEVRVRGRKSWCLLFLFECHYFLIWFIFALGSYPILLRSYSWSCVQRLFWQCLEDPMRCLISNTEQLCAKKKLIYLLHYCSSLRSWCLEPNF